MYNEAMYAIRNNPFLKDLEDAVAQFGMCGIFIWAHHSEQPQDNGYYFLCGYDRQTIEAAAKESERLYDLQRSKKSIRLDLHICRVTDRSAFNVHQEVMEYCFRAATMGFLFKWAGLTHCPKRISSEFLQVSLWLYEKLRTSDLPVAEKKRWEKLLKHHLLRQGEQELMADGECLTPGKPEKIGTNAPRNQKTLPELLYNCISTVPKTVSRNDLPRVLDALANRPYLQYYQTKPAVPKFLLPDSLLHRTKKCEDLASVTFIIDAFYEKEFDLILLGGYPRTTGKKLREKQTDHCRFGLRPEDIHTVCQCAKAANIVIALDRENPYFNYVEQLNVHQTDGYAFVCALKDVDRLEHILLDIAKQSRQRSSAIHI